MTWAGLDWRGPDIRSGLVNRHLIIEGRIEVLEGHRRSYSVSPSPSPFPLDFGFRIWDLNLGPDFGTWIWDWTLA